MAGPFGGPRSFWLAAPEPGYDPRAMDRLRWPLLLVAGAALVALAQPRADTPRHRRQLDSILVFVPSAAGVRVASSGFEEVASDLFWVRTVLLFGERFGTASTAAWVEWLARMADSVTTLDPTWSTPYHYGSGMLRVVGAIPESSALLERCTEHRPHDYWCPMSRGMNDLLYNHEPAAAATWLVEAARRPGAPPWYGAAAAAMQSDAGQRHAGLKYLDDRLAEETDPRVVDSLQTQRNRLWHDELVDRWAADCRAHREAVGPLARPEDLALLGHDLPANPRGDAWVVGADGVVRSEGAEVERVLDRRAEEWELVRRR